MKNELGMLLASMSSKTKSDSMLYHVGTCANSSVNMRATVLYFEQNNLGFFTP